MRIARARASDLRMRLLTERAGVRVRRVARVLAALVGIRPFRGVWIVHRVRQRVVRRGVLRDVAGVLAWGLGEAADRLARLRLAWLRSLQGLGRRFGLLRSLRLLGLLGLCRPFGAFLGGIAIPGGRRRLRR